MRTITVEKDELLATLRVNMDDHRETFVCATRVFREKSVEWLDSQIKAVQSGKNPERYMPLPIPEEHTEDYERAIEMLAWHIGDTVELTEQEFIAYVQDNWGWRQSWISNTTSYTGEQ